MANANVMCWGLNDNGQLGTGSNVGPDTCDFAPAEGPQPPPGPVGGVGLTPNVGSRSSPATAGLYFAMAGVAAVLLVTAAGALYARKRIRRD
jgi:hypothetical protein